MYYLLFIGSLLCAIASCIMTLSKETSKFDKINFSILSLLYFGFCYIMYSTGR